MIQLVSADGAFEQGVRRVEQVLLRLLGEQQRLGHLVDDDLVLRTHARILEMQTNAQLTLRRARNYCCRCAGSAPAQRGDPWRRPGAGGDPAQGLDAVPQAAMPLFTRPQSTFLGTASQVESYVFALARFEPKPAQFPKSSGTRKSNGPTRPPRTAREMIERCQAALPLPDLMQWLLAQEPDGATDELLYWFSRLSRDALFRTPATPRVRNHRTLRQPLLLRPEPRRQGQGPGQGRRHPFRERNPCILISPN